MSFTSLVHELKTLAESYHPLVVIDTVEEERARQLVAATSRALGLSFYEWSISSGIRLGTNEGHESQAIGTTREATAMLRHIKTLNRSALYLMKDIGPHLEDPVNVRLLRELCQNFTRNSATMILTGSAIDLPGTLGPYAAYLPLDLPNAQELDRLMQSVMESLSQFHSTEVDLAPGDRERIVEALRGLTLNQARQAIAYAGIEDGRLNAADIPKLIDRKARWIQDNGLLEYFPAGDNRFEIGGFENLKQWLGRAQQGFTKEAAALNLAPPGGVLMVGVQGCGKSLAAKTISRLWQQPLLKLDAGRLFDKFIGESDKNLRRALALAESMAPSILWIDEIEKAFGASSDDSGDGGLGRRIQGALLTWLQEKKAPVFVVATANDVFSLPPELMRKGRFDEVFFVDLPKPKERRAIFEIHLRLRRQEPDTFQIDDLVLASEGMSGAEIEQAVVAALYRSLHEKTPCDQRKVLAELDATVPLSTSRREDIDRLRSLAQERFVPVS